MTDKKPTFVNVELTAAHTHGGITYPPETVLSVRADQAERLKNGAKAKEAAKGAKAVNVEVAV